MGSNSSKSGGNKIPRHDNSSVMYTKEYLQKRINVIEDNIILYEEVEWPNKDTFNFMMDHLRKKSIGFEERGFYLIGSSLEMKNRANSQDREEIIKRYKDLDNLNHLAVVVNENRIVRVLIKYVFRKSVVKSVSTHKTFEEALDHINKLKTREYKSNSVSG